jgi:hypothetical protein
VAKIRTILLALILAAGIANGLKALNWEWARRSDPDLVGEQERRHLPIRLDPQFPTTVSYAGDPDALEPGDKAGFRLLQYTVVPILVSDRLDQEWLIWRGPEPKPGEETLRGFTLSRKLGDGLYLYHRGEP